MITVYWIKHYSGLSNECQTRPFFQGEWVYSQTAIRSRVAESYATFVKCVNDSKMEHAL